MLLEVIEKVKRCPENGRNIFAVSKSRNRKCEKSWVSVPALLQSQYLFAVFFLVCEIKLEVLPLL